MRVGVERKGTDEGQQVGRKGKGTLGGERGLERKKKRSTASDILLIFFHTSLISCSGILLAVAFHALGQYWPGTSHTQSTYQLILCGLRKNVGFIYVIHKYAISAAAQNDA